MVTKSKKKGYIDNEHFLELLIEFQEINDDTTEWYKRLRSDRADFKKLKKKKRNERIKMLKDETEEQRRIRVQRLNVVKNKLGNHFMLIAQGLIKNPKFINYDYFRKEEMVSDATYFMVNYVDRYDTERTNPFAYFTQIAFNAFLQHINKCNKISDTFTNITYIENMDNTEVGDWD